MARHQFCSNLQENGKTPVLYSDQLFIQITGAVFKITIGVPLKL